MPRNTFKQFANEAKAATQSQQQQSDNEALIVESVNPNHPIEKDLLAIKDNEEYRSKVIELTGLISGFEVGKALLYEAKDGVQTYTTSINNANTTFATSVDKAGVVIANFRKAVDDARKVQIPVVFSQEQRSAMNSLRDKMFEDEKRIWETHGQGMLKLAEYQRKSFKRLIDDNSDYNIVSNDVCITFVSLFIGAIFCLGGIIMANIEVLHNPALTKVFWCWGICSVLVIAYSIYTGTR